MRAAWDSETGKIARQNAYWNVVMALASKLLELLGKNAKTEETLRTVFEQAADRVRAHQGDAGIRTLPTGYIMAPLNLAVHAVLQSFHGARNRKGWSDNGGNTVPMYRQSTNEGQGMILLAYRGFGETIGAETADLQPLLWQRVERMGDWESDAFLAALGQWTMAGSDLNEPFFICADTVLDHRGRERKRYSDEAYRWSHGHRTEDRLRAGEALSNLTDCWLTIDVVGIPAGKKRRELRVQVNETPLLVVSLRRVQLNLDGTNAFIVGVHARWGEWVKAFGEARLRQMGLIARQALAYDPVRERGEKRLAKYLAFKIRWDAKYQRETVRLTVGTLLDEASIRPDTAHPQTTRERLETVLKSLKRDHVIADWGYVVEESERNLPSRGWLDKWRRWVIAITPPELLSGYYKSLHSPDSEVVLPSTAS